MLYVVQLQHGTQNCIDDEIYKHSMITVDLLKIDIIIDETLLIYNYP